MINEPPDRAQTLAVQTVCCSDITKSFPFYEAVLMAATGTRPFWKRIGERTHVTLVRLVDGTDCLIRLQQDKDGIVRHRGDEPIEADGMPTSFIRLPIPNPGQALRTFFTEKWLGEDLGTLGYGSIRDPDGQAVCLHRQRQERICQDPVRTDEFYQALVPHRAMGLFAGHNLSLDDGTWIEFRAESGPRSNEARRTRAEAFALKITDTFQEVNWRLQAANFHGSLLLAEKGLDPNARIRMTTDPDGRPVIVRTT